MDAREVLRRLGGARFVAERFGLAVSTVHNWPERGIPHHLRYPMLQLGREQGAELSEDDLFEDPASQTSRK